MNNINKKINRLGKNVYKSQVFDYLYAFLLTVIVLAQLFTFDNFLTELVNLNLLENDNVVIALGVFVVILEVFALPFLLRMKLKALSNSFSMFFAVAVLLFWFLMPLGLLISGNNGNIGILGSVKEVSASWFFVTFVGVFLTVFIIEIYYYLKNIK